MVGSSRAVGGWLVHAIIITSYNIFPPVIFTLPDSRECGDHHNLITIISPTPPSPSPLDTFQQNKYICYVIERTFSRLQTLCWESLYCKFSFTICIDLNYTWLGRNGEYAAVPFSKYYFAIRILSQYIKNSREQNVSSCESIQTSYLNYSNKFKF